MDSWPVFLGHSYFQTSFTQSSFPVVVPLWTGSKEHVLTGQTPLLSPGDPASKHWKTQWWRLGSVVVHWPRPTKLLYARPVITGTGDHLWTGKPPRFVTSHSSQLSLLSSVGQKISTGQSEVTLCGWGVFIPLVDTCVMCWWQVQLCDPSLTRVIPEHFRDEFLTIKGYTNLQLLCFTFTPNHGHRPHHFLIHQLIHASSPTLVAIMQCLSQGCRPVSQHRDAFRTFLLWAASFG